MKSMLEQFESAKIAGVPLVAIDTADPAMTMKQILDAYGTKIALLAWDISRALVALNTKGTKALPSITGGLDPIVATGNPSEMLVRIASAPEDTTIFMCNAHKFYNAPQGNEGIIQGIWNLRDIFKNKGCMLIMLAPVVVLPSELKNDVMVISEPLPDKADIEKIAMSVIQGAKETFPKGEMPQQEIIDKYVDILTGLSGFSAEQTMATSIIPKGQSFTIDVTGLWDRKTKAIEQTRGLQVYKRGPTFADIGGLENIKQYLKAEINGREKVRVVGLWDEIEKTPGMGGTVDTSGVDTDQLAVFLQAMQDNEWRGMIFLGVPGGAKTQVVKAVANECDVLGMQIDPGAMKGGLVGQSEEYVRDAVKVIQAISGGKFLLIATSNNISVLKAELKRRFGSGTFFFDLPDDDEKSVIWKIYIRKYELLPGQLDEVDDSDWSGADIRQCCRIAWQQSKKLSEASKYIVPVAKSAPKIIQTLREDASTKYISASKEGFYVYQPLADRKARKISAVWMQ